MKKVSKILLKIVLYPVFIVVAYYAVLWSHIGLHYVVKWCVSWDLLNIIFFACPILGGYCTLAYVVFIVAVLAVTKLKLNNIFAFVVVLIFNCFFSFRELKIIWSGVAGEASTLLLILTSLPTIGLFLAILIPSLMALGAEKD